MKLALLPRYLPALIKELKGSGFVPVKFTPDMSATGASGQLRASIDNGARSQSGGSFRCSPDLVRVPAGENTEFVYSPLTREMAVLPASKLRLLRKCNTFKTLDEHTRLISHERQFSALHFKALRRSLEELAGAGLLDSRQTLVAQFKQEASSAAKAQITSIAIPTRNRADKLKIAVESYARCCKKYRQDVSFYIADQSDHKKAQRATLDVLTSAKEQFGYPIYYAGFEEKEKLARSLAAHTGHPFDLVHFAVGNDEGCPKAYGANRNALLLSTIGFLTLQTDDDGQCRIKASPEWKAGLTLTSKFSALRWYFPTAPEVESLEHGFADGDIFSVHQQLLGKSLAQCIERHSHLDLEGTANSFFAHQAPPVVCATMLGTAGGSGIGTSFWSLIQDEKARASLLRSEEHYRYAISSQELIRFAANPIISDGAFCGGLNLGLDNRQLLPPFMPVQRNEDVLFGQLMRLGSCGYFGFPPWITLHTGPATTMNTDDLRQFAARVPCGHIIEALLKELAPRPKHADPAKNLVDIGKKLIDFASGPLPDFEERLRLMLMRRASLLISKLQSHLNEYNREPEFWASDVDMCVAAIEEAMESKESIVASDLCPYFPEEVARPLLQRLIRRFGELLTIWADLRQAAQELQDSGWQPFRQL
jgi:hypothetical protein